MFSSKRGKAGKRDFCEFIAQLFGVHQYYKASPSRTIPPQNGGIVGNAVGIERQKGRAAPAKYFWRSDTSIARLIDNDRT